MDTFHFQRFEPQIGNNLDLPPAQRLFFEIGCGLTKVQLKRCRDAVDFSAIVVSDEAAKAEATQSGDPLEVASVRLLTQACADQLAREWAPFVKLGGGPHKLGEREVTTLRDYLVVVLEQVGGFNVLELATELGDRNSVTGTRALFSKRRSGGTTSTVAQKTDAAAGATGSR